MLLRNMRLDGPLTRSETWNYLSILVISHQRINAKWRWEAPNEMKVIFGALAFRAIGRRMPRLEVRTISLARSRDPNEHLSSLIVQRSADSPPTVGVGIWTGEDRELVCPRLQRQRVVGHLRRHP